MKFAFPILAAVAVLFLGAGSAQAARPIGGNSNIILPPAPPLQSSLPPMTNSGALNTPQPLGMPPVNTGALVTTGPASLGVPGQQSFGALPGNPGSATYNPNAALPSLGNSGSAIAPDEGSSTTGVNTPSTGVNALNTNANGGM
jgi:hypothetical protein